MSEHFEVAQVQQLEGERRCMQEALRMLMPALGLSGVDGDVTPVFVELVMVPRARALLDLAVGAHSPASGAAP